MKYNKVTEEDIRFLESVTGNDRCLYGPRINQDYAHDELGGVEKMPDVLLRVKSTEEVAAIMSRDTILFAEEYLGKRFPDSKSSAYILMTFDGMSKSRVEDEYNAIAELCLENGAKDVYLVDTDERKDSVWKSRGAFLEAIKASCEEMDECDVVVPRDRIAEYIDFTHKLAGEYNMVQTKTRI